MRGFRVARSGWCLTTICRPLYCGICRIIARVRGKSACQNCVSISNLSVI